jgi:hypothetical protein
MKQSVKHCLPGEGYGDESWFERLNAFEKQETRRQVAFKRYHWPELEDGVWSKRPDYHYPHILPENNMTKALFPPVAEEILLYLDREDIALHNEALNLRSSQVCCFNILFPLKKDKDLAKLVLEPLLPQVKDIEDIEFEYTGPCGTTKWLGEPPEGKRGQNRTSIDAAIWWKDNMDKQCITLLEWKYTERSFGSCGGYESNSNVKKKHCWTLDAAGIHPGSKCFLTAGGPQRSRRYWEHLAEADIDNIKFKDIKGCPFRGPFYQILRQSLLAEHLRQKLDNINKVEVAVLSFAGNESLLKCPPNLKSLIQNTKGNVIDAWNAVTPGAPPVRHIMIEEIMEAADTFLPQDNAWRCYVKERYGV